MKMRHEATYLRTARHHALKIHRICHMGGSDFKYYSKLVASICTFNVLDERYIV